MNRIRIRDITKDFFSMRRGRITALKGIDLEIDAGSFFVLLGPSGCGKSTLLNIIAGIEKPTGGEIVIGEQSVVNIPQRRFLSPKQRDIAMVFQSYALYPHMTVFENIAFPLKIAKLPAKEIHDRVESAAVTLEIDHLLEAKPRELSGGQRQRVALGRAIVRKPNVLLLDEPLSNLDALLRASMRGELKQIQRNLQVTTIYVTHDQVEAMSLGDRIAVMQSGEVQQVGKPDEVYHDPANRFVATFLGNPPINLMDATLFTTAKHPSALAIPNYKNIILGIRPEHMNVGTSSGFLKGKLSLIGSLGSEILLYIRVEGQEIIARTSEASQFTEGQEVYVSFDETHLLMFDRDGRRIRQTREDFPP
jgi:multiple sugar transport system ATP-binding protein